MSSARQTVVRGPIFTGGGKRPDLQPLNQADRLMGMMGSTLRFLQPTICQRRRKPDSGMVLDMRTLRSNIVELNDAYSRQLRILRKCVKPQVRKFVCYQRRRFLFGPRE